AEPHVEEAQLRSAVLFTLIDLRIWKFLARNDPSKNRGPDAPPRKQTGRGLCLSSNQMIDTFNEQTRRSG
ncbi:MAG: hypothetical protein ABI127_05355, partial [Dokdonella sp.]